VTGLVKKGIYVVQYAGDADYNCNWLGGEVVSERVSAPGFTRAGYQNISTSDAVVHGQVKQSANFAFARIYDSGHEVPFYQPLAALELFDRAIHHTDIATGKTAVARGCNYTSAGTARSTYREGNSTVQFDVLSPDATYNTTTNAPNPGSVGNGTASSTTSGGSARMMVQKQQQQKAKKGTKKQKQKQKQKRAYFKPLPASKRRGN